MSNKIMKTLTMGENIYEIYDESARTDIATLQTETRQLSDTVNDLKVGVDKDTITEAVNNYLGENPVKGGISTTATALLMAVLKSCYTSSNQDVNLDALERELLSSSSGGDTPSEPDEPDTPVDPDEPTIPILTSISAVANKTTVAVGTKAEDLDITVTAHYSDGTTATITDYSISGTVGVGENTFTIVYGGKTTTVTVTGNALAYSLYNKDMNEGEVDFGIELNELKTFTVKYDITMNATLNNVNIFGWKPLTSDGVPVWLVIKERSTGNTSVTLMQVDATNIGNTGNLGYPSAIGDRHQFVATYDNENGTCEIYVAETPSGGTMVHKSKTATVDKSLYDGILGVTGINPSHRLPMGDYTVNACEISWEHTSETDAIAWFEREV